MERVVDLLELPYGAGTLAGKLTVASPRSLIEIKVSDPAPQRAADIANAIAQVFIADFRDNQFLEIARFQASLAQYGIVEDPSIIAAQTGTMSTLRVAEAAEPPSYPISPNKRLHLVLGVVIGLLVSGIAFIILELMDDRIRSPEEYKSLTGIDTIGSVMRHQQGGDGVGPVILEDEHSRSAMSEAFKFIRTNLHFAALGTNEFKSLLVTSADPEEGKSGVGWQ